MHARFTTLLRHKLDAEAGRFRVVDLVFDPEDGMLHSALVDVGGLLRRTEALIRARRLGAIDEDGTWQSSLDSDDVLSAPRIDDPDARPYHPDITDWPPMVVGPFGTTQAPLLLAAQLFGPGPGRGVRLPQRLERWSDWDGALVFGPTGPFARITDFEVDLTTGRLTCVLLSINGKEYVCPLYGIRSFVQGDGYAVSDLTQDDLRAGITSAVPGPQLDRTAAHRGWVAT